MVVAVGGKVISIVDVLDKPETCAKVRGRLLTGFILDALESGSSGKQASNEDAETLLRRMDGLPWERTTPAKASVLRPKRIEKGGRNRG